MSTLLVVLILTVLSAGLAIRMGRRPAPPAAPRRPERRRPSDQYPGLLDDPGW